MKINVTKYGADNGTLRSTYERVVIYPKFKISRLQGFSDQFDEPMVFHTCRD